MKDTVITGSRIFLKKLKLKYATTKYSSWLNDPQVNRFLSTKKATIASLKQYIREKNKNKNCLFLGIFLKKSGIHIGNIKLEPIDFRRKKATLGVMVGDKHYWGKGLGKEAIEILTEWAFTEIGLEKIYLGVDKKNIRAIKSYQGVGFQMINGTNRMILKKRESIRLVLGTAQFGIDYGINNKEGKISQKEAFQILDYAKQNHISYLDTAYGYGQSEVTIGQYMIQYKKKFNIISKFPSKKINNIDFYLKSSLDRLRTDEFYAYLYHSFDYFIQHPKSIEILRKYQNQGFIRKIGFSLYYPRQLDYLIKKKIKFDIVQVPYSVFDQRFAQHLKKIRKLEIEAHVRSVFLQGLIFKNSSLLPSTLKHIKPKLIRLKRISEKEKLSIACLCLNFTLLNKNIDKIVIGVDSLANLKENLRVIKYKSRVKKVLSQLKQLKERNEKIILPFNW